MNKEKLLKEFSERYDYRNLALSDSIRKLLDDPIGALLIEEIEKWLYEKLTILNK